MNSATCSRSPARRRPAGAPVAWSWFVALGVGALGADTAQAQHWVSHVPSSGVSRGDHGLVYDTARQTYVLFGGSGPSPSSFGYYYSGCVNTNDVLEWDGSRWSQHFRITAPAPRNRHAMAYDAARGVSVVFGGDDGSTVFSDTWTWDGSNWTLHRPAVQPPALRGHAMVYDAARQRVVLFGGETAAGSLAADTWEWDGSNWLQRTPAQSPPALVDQAMAYDTNRQRVVLFGESVGGSLGNWTAEAYPTLSGHSAPNWRLAAGASSVTQTDNSQPAVYYSDFTLLGNDVQAELVVNAGDDDYVGFAIGFQPGDASNPNADYLLVDWKASTQPFTFGSPSCTPGTTAQAGLAVSRVTGIPTADEFWGHTNFDATCSGLSSGLQELARATNLGSTGWSAGTNYTFRFVLTATNLKVYVNNVLEIDLNGTFADGRLGFYSFSQSVTFNELPVPTLSTRTWEWDGSDWSPHSSPPMAAPGDRQGHAMAYDPGRQRMILFGGQNSAGPLADTWLWDGTQWVQGAPARSPIARRGHAMLYDEVRQRVVLYGGREPSCSTRFTTVWEYGADALAAARTYGSGCAGMRTSPIAVTPNSSWVAPPSGSMWIGLDQGPAAVPAGTYVYALTFDLSGFDPATAMLTGQWATDNDAMIVLNGVDTGITTSVSAFGSLQSFTISSGFVPGTNTVEFRVNNNSGPSGLLVAGLSGTATSGGTAAAIPGLFNTGVDDMGVALLPGEAEQHYAYTGPAVSLARPQLNSSGLPALGNATFTLDITTVPALTSVTFAFADQLGNVPLGSNCTLLVSLTSFVVLVPTMSDASGQASLPMPVPPVASLAGLSLYSQGIVVDATGPFAGLTLTNGLRFTIGE